MESKLVSLVLAQALVTLPKITAAELHEKCVEACKAEGKEALSLPLFRIELSKWLNDGTIPGYEARLGRTGGIYKKGAAMVSLNNQSSEKKEIDSAQVIAAINLALESAPRITTKDLYEGLKLEGITEAQFRTQMAEWFNDGTLKDFESRKGSTGGVYRRGSDTEIWTPSVDSEDSEESGGFTVQISPSLKIVCSDDRNWTIQKLSGETWQNKAYHSDMRSCIQSVIKHAQNGEFKLSNSVVQLKDLAKVIQEMEGRLFKQIETCVALAQN